MVYNIIKISLNKLHACPEYNVLSLIFINVNVFFGVCIVEWVIDLDLKEWVFM